MFKDKLMKLLFKNNKTNKNKENNQYNESKIKDIEINNKKKIENMFFVMVLIIITVVVINYIWNGNKTSNNTNINSTGKQLAVNKNNSRTSTKTNSKDNRSFENNNYCPNQENIGNNLERRLENILKTINGVKDVNVFINYSESNETVAMYNENSKTSITEEGDKSGGTRKIEQTDSQKEIVYQEERWE